MEGCPHFPRAEGSTLSETTGLGGGSQVQREQSSEHCASPLNLNGQLLPFPLTQPGSGEGLLSPVVGFRMPLGEERMFQMDGPGFHARTPLLLFYWGFIMCKAEQKVPGTIRL